MIFLVMALSGRPLFTAGGSSLSSAGMEKQENMDTATFGAGCFWCVEAVFRELKGVERVVSGYSGGTVKNPSYREVTTGRTGHAEAVQLTYDPTVTGYDELLKVFWSVHDPITLNRQGAGAGTQYRPVVFWHNEEQRDLAERYKKKLDRSGAFSKPVVTELSPFTAFYPAEESHQKYFLKNPGGSYCRMVVRPKMEKFREIFRDKLRQVPSH